MEEVNYMWAFNVVYSNVLHVRVEVDGIDYDIKEIAFSSKEKALEYLNEHSMLIIDDELHALNPDVEYANPDVEYAGSSLDTSTYRLKNEYFMAMVELHRKILV